MRAAIDFLMYVNVVTALLLAGFAMWRWRRTGTPGRWGAAAFAALALVLVVAALDPELTGEWKTKALVCVLVAFPYLLLIFSSRFGAVPRWWLRTGHVLICLIVVGTLLLPAIPEEGDPQPGWMQVYTYALLVYWTALSAATIVGLWKAGRGQPTLSRRRLRLMSAATGALNVLILVATTRGDQTHGTSELTTQVLLFLSLVMFGLGYAPPLPVRLAWRQPEQDALRRATEELVGATTVSQVTDTLLPHVARMVGGSGAAVVGERDEVVASFGVVAAVDDPPHRRNGSTTLTIPLSAPFRSLVVSTSPVTPFFGEEEVGLLHSLGALADLSLTRCDLAEKDREHQAALRVAMKETERANSAKTDFLSRMSHELRTPLNAILGFGQLLELGSLNDGEQEEAVDQILKAGRHLLGLINEVLDLSRIESGRMTMSPEPVEMAGLAREAVDLIRPLANDRSVALEADLEDCHFSVVADRQRLKQVLLNLLSNAVKYNRHGGSVQIACSPAGVGRTRLSVIDSGPGIPEALLDKLFEPFERLGAEQTVEEGTGLGLALSKQLVELMEGEIGVDTREGEGSRFWVELNIAEPADDGGVEDVVVSSERPTTSRPQERQILLIEDNLSNLKLIERIIARRPHIELLPAMTGRLGLELAREHQPDLILLDQHLPDVRGAEVLQRLRADPATRSIPVVIVSAQATPGQSRRLLELGAVDYLTKPLDVRNFLEVLDRILDDDSVTS